MFMAPRYCIHQNADDPGQAEPAGNATWRGLYNSMPRDRVSGFFNGLFMLAGDSKAHTARPGVPGDEELREINDAEGARIAFGRRSFNFPDFEHGVVASTTGRPYLTVRELVDGFLALWRRPLPEELKPHAHKSTWSHL
jgi:hypothetical protein